MFSGGFAKLGLSWAQLEKYNLKFLKNFSSCYVSNEFDHSNKSCLEFSDLWNCSETSSPN